MKLFKFTCNPCSIASLVAPKIFMLLLLRIPEPEYKMSKLYVEVRSGDSVESKTLEVLS